MRRPICISGKELCNQPLSGIPRYMFEVIKNIDWLMKSYSTDLDIRLCIPKNEKFPIAGLKNIKIVEVETNNDDSWNTGAFKRYVRKVNGFFVGMANNKTLIKDSIIVLHDVRPLVTNRYDSIRDRAVFFMQAILARIFARNIVTVSEYQKDAICKKLHVKPDKVKVTYNGYEHIKMLNADNGIFLKYPRIVKGEYYYSIGSVAKHKNYKWISEVAKRNPEKIFVIAGGQLVKKWGVDSSEYQQRNIIYVGFVTDEENKALMMNCRAFLHPSKYEGFGIPPLEALYLGKPIVVSNSTCLPEIYDGLATFFDPDDYTVDVDKFFFPDKEILDKAFEKYSWEKTGKIWLDLFQSLK